MRSGKLTLLDSGELVRWQ